MQTETLNIDGHLLTGGRKIPISARYASKYSLMVRFLNGESFNDGSEFSKLILQVNDESVEMGSCRIISEPNIGDCLGRLVFVDNVCDLDHLFFKNKIMKLQTPFLSLSTILAHKEEIRQSFKNYTADLTYDLSVYKSLFDKVDSEYREEPESIKELIQKAVIDTHGRQFMQFLDDKLEELKHIVADFSKEEHERHGFYFRRQLWDFILCSPLLARTNLKPRGYSGDSEMMRMIYTNGYEGDSTFSKLMHKHPLEQPAAQAVRTRRDIVANMLRSVKQNHLIPGERVTILSVACGPAFELKDLLLFPEDCTKYHFTLLDQDRFALLEAAELINQIESHLDSKIEVNYLNESVRTMLATARTGEHWGEFDFIYSMGLFDYLTPPVAKAVLHKLLRLVKPGGEIVIGNFHVSNPNRYYMEYWADWVLYYRTEDEFQNLLNDDWAGIQIFFDSTKSQMFLHVKKHMF